MTELAAARGRAPLDLLLRRGWLSPGLALAGVTVWIRNVEASGSERTVVTSSMLSGASRGALREGQPSPAIDKADVLIELTLVLLAAHLVVSAILRRYYLGPLGLQPWSRHAVLVLLLLLCLLGLRVWRNERWLSGAQGGRQLGRWLGGLRWPDLVLAAPFLFSLTLLEPSYASLGADSGWFFGQLRLAVMEGRVDLETDLERGPTLLWGPFYVLAHVLTLIARGLGADVAADGLGLPYLNAVRLGSLSCAFAAAIMAHRVCRRFFDPTLAAFCVAGAWLGSPLLYYSVFEPAMAHAPATVAASLFLLLWVRLREDPTRGQRWMGVALAGALLLFMQRYDVYFLAAPVMTALGRLRESMGARSGRRGALLPLATLGAFLLAVLPFVLASLRTEGFLWGHALRYWNRPHVGELLFSSNGGLFSWTPVAYLGVLGLCLLRKDRPLAMILLLTLGLGVYLLASTEAWSGGMAFGGRRLTEAFPIFALGLCGVGEWLMRRPQALGVAALAGLVFWNFSLAVQVRTGALPQGTTVSFSQAAQTAVAQLYERVGNLSSFPASWIFGLKYGVSPERFDAIYGHPPHHDLAIAIGSPEDAVVVGRGWSPPYRPPEVAPHRWSAGAESTLLVPLDPPRDRRLRLAGSASQTPENLSQTIELLVNNEPLSAITVPPRPTVVEVDIPARLWKKGLNVISFRYAWTLAAADAVGPDPAGSAWRLERLELASEE